MDDKFGSRFKKAWNVFFNKNPTEEEYKYSYGVTYATRQGKARFSGGNERSIVNAIYNRISIDVAALPIKHVRLDKDGRYLSDMDSTLNNCLNLEANIDQTGRSLIQDAVISLLDEGSIAIIPVDTTGNFYTSNSYDILSLRVAKIIEWMPYHIRVKAYDERIGQQKEIILPKTVCAIVENPLYSVINEPFSILNRLVRKLNLLDAIDEQSGSGKLDLIIQLPYSIKTETRRNQANERRQDIENQLTNSKYGVAYIDSTEHVTQLNRAVENNLMKQIDYLTSMLYSQLGITQSILDGSADEQTKLNYNNTTIEPIISAIVKAMNRSFLTQTARTQRQAIMFFMEPFKLVSVSNIADIADKLTRNEICTSNEIRQMIGFKPSKDPSADELRNKNLNQPSEDSSSPPAEKTSDTIELYNNLSTNDNLSIKDKVLEIIKKI